MYFVFIYENRIMKPIEIFPRRECEEIEKYGEGESKIYCKHVCNYHNISPA
jgi:hypothetical protein